MAYCFFKVILKHHLQSNTLMLPTKFTREYGNEFSETAELVLSDGRTWKLGLQTLTNVVFLNDGFRDFANYYSLSHGHMLFFEYRGMSRFSVHIHDKTSCEISYPSNDPNNRKPRNDCKYMSKCRIATPGYFKSPRPYFKVELKKYNFILNLVYVPANVSGSIKETQVKNQSILLEVGDGRLWKVSLCERNLGRLGLGKMKAFYSENDLKETDVCIFEVVKKDLLKVYIFSAV